MPTVRIESFSTAAKRLIKSIPRGKVATYGQIAAYAGNPSGARQVGWLLHSSSTKYKLPWQRVINSKGQISLPRGDGYEVQKELLKKEGIAFGRLDTVDFDKYLWHLSIKSVNRKSLGRKRGRKKS
jgi:methylated-DNA-protein-cysteine methyltransferase-like protein